LPQLYHLDWGFPYFENPHWSPNGRWIAVMAHDSSGYAHLEVVSPDGQHRYDLRAWGCHGPWIDFDWLPDSQLGCVATPDAPGAASFGNLCIGGFPFTSCTATPLRTPLLTNFMASEKGMIWMPDGSSFLLSATTLDASNTLTTDDLYVLSAGGVVIQRFTDGTQYGIYEPELRPHQATISYIVSDTVGTVEPSMTPDALVTRAILSDTHMRLTLGAPQTIVRDDLRYYTYSWSPTGHWIAIRHADYRGGDKIYLVNPDNPSQMVDVVLADKLGRQMNDPIWSPDGKTLIVFGVGYGVSPPYRMDIASYLASKGLSV